MYPSAGTSDDWRIVAGADPGRRNALFAGSRLFVARPTLGAPHLVSELSVGVASFLIAGLGPSCVILLRLLLLGLAAVVILSHIYARLINVGL
jgi:hypothetical protein